MLINNRLWESSSYSQTHCGLIKSGKHFHCAPSCKPVDENLFVEKENVLQDQSLQVGVLEVPQMGTAGEDVRHKYVTLR